ncbi:hypothetical protein MKEN_01473800 [Mycena kentingensis (nom. inval.)]|nr:hypothetical protein MKEN_01473800 [Mycena kentingensis (nom. inval.)]
MGSLCFSNPSILRCASFTTLENQLLIIPTALELLFASALIFTNRGNGWRHLLLTAEGWSYFALALLELLSHTLPAVRDSVSVFSVVDIILGATSFLPIFFYTLFVYLFTRGELIGTLPKRLQNVASVLLIFFIPAVIALNELSSFIGVQRRTITLNDRQVVAIGFRTFNDQQIWTFLSSITLALLTGFQAINFCFAFYRLIRAFVDQRRIETTSSDQAHPIRGIGWISGGLKLGAIETVVGFAQGGFGGALTRRILRFLARGCLVVGMVKGLDRVDDFTEVRKELDANRGKFRRSRLGNLISNPRFSSFQQLTPTATQFYDAPRAVGPSPLSRQLSEKQPGMNEFAQIRREASMTERERPRPISMVQSRSGTFDSYVTEDSNGFLRPRPRERVTVHHGSGSAPTLHLRFSGLDMPSPAVIADNVKSRPVSNGWVSIARSSRYAASSFAPSFAFDTPVPQPPVPAAYPEFIFAGGMTSPDAPTALLSPPQTNRRDTRAVSEYSARSSAYPDTLNAVRELANQFPGTPAPYVESYQSIPRPPPIPERSEWVDDDDVESQRYSRRSFDEIDSAYAASVRQQFQDREVPPMPAMAYAYDGMEKERADSPEPVFHYRYGADESPEDHYSTAYSPPVINPESPPRHRPTQSDTTLGTAAAMGGFGAYVLSPFGDSTSTPATEISNSNENPFAYDDDRHFPSANKQQGVPQAVYMEDGPHTYAGTDAPYERTSAALLQMTQREEVDWAPAEFTPSMFTAPSPAATSMAARRQTLKKKRRPSPTKRTPTQRRRRLQSPRSVARAQHQPHRVKSVGRQRAPQKSTPVPVNARHGMTRGSVYIQPITVPPQHFHSEVQIVQGSGSADSTQSEFVVDRT